MTAIEIKDLIKLLRTGNNKRTIEYIDNMLDATHKEAKLLWPLYKDESCIGGIHDD